MSKHKHRPRQQPESHITASPQFVLSRGESAALMIPESLVAAPAIEQEAFTQLRRCLPAECVVWHQIALELDSDELVPFLGMAGDTGIFTVHPFGWESADLAASPGGDGAALAPAARAEMEVARRKHQALYEDLCGSQLPVLVDAGRLKPAMHLVALLARLPGSAIHRHQLYAAMPDVLLVGRDQVDQLFAILKSNTQPARQLSDEQISAVRSIIAPGCAIRLPHRHAQVIDGAYQPGHPAGQYRPLPLLLDVKQEQIIKSFAEIPPDQVGITRDLDTRLVRGVVGSGKSLILLHRARFLNQLYPDWRVLAVTYTRALADFLRTRYLDVEKGASHTEIASFHVWCRALLQPKGLWPANALAASNQKGLLTHLAQQLHIPLDSTQAAYLIEEFDWIRDMGIRDWDTYAAFERHGRKQRLSETQRAQAWQLLQAYRQEMRRNNQFDWAEITIRMLEALDAGQIAAEQYHAVLIDEAQDFGAAWFTILQRMLKPSSNLMFIVADGAQKIYGRSFSWKSLGVDVTGNRSRVLNRSYRNTFEILRTAYEVVRGDPATIAELQSLGDMLIQPDLDSHRMRHGPLPILWSLTHAAEEAAHIGDEIHKLHDNGYAWGEFAIFGRDHATLETIGQVLRARNIPVCVATRQQDIHMASDDVKVLTLHASKGLEFSVVFIAGADRLQPRAGLSAEDLAKEIAAERRLLYVGMTRARDRLYLTHTGSLPLWAAGALSLVEHRR